MPNNIFEELSKDEVLALVEAYRSLNLTDVNVPSFETKKDAIPWLVEAATTIGTVHIVTAEESATEEFSGRSEGEVIFTPPVAPEAPVAPGEEVETPADTNAGEAVAAEESAPVPAPGVAPAQFYRGKPVISVQNKINNGRTYKEVFLAGETLLLTEDEFAREIR